MRVVLKTLVLAGNVGREIIAITVRSDDADHGEEGSRSVTDLDNQDFDISFEPEPVSEIEESKIKAVMEQSSCTRDHAFNALLSHDWDIAAAKMFLSENQEDDGKEGDGTESEASSTAPLTKPLPSGRQWGECDSELSSVQFGVSSQYGGAASQGNIGEQVVVTARKGFPTPSRNDRESQVGILLEHDSIIFSGTDDLSWAELHTDLPRYNGLRYRFLKINSHSVNNRKEFDQAIASLNPGDAATFILAKILFSQGEGIGELFGACVSGDAKIVKRIIESNQEINVNKALTGAYADLQKYGADVEEGYTPLMVAGENDHSAVVKELLSHSEIDVNIADRDGKTVLSKVSEKGLSDVVGLLLAHPGTDANKKDSHELAPLHEACYEGHTEIVQQLLERKGIDINHCCHHTDTPLSAASKRDHSEIVKLLLERSAKLPRNKPTGFDNCSPEIIKMLVKHKKLNRDGSYPDPNDQNAGREEHDSGQCSIS